MVPRIYNTYYTKCILMKKKIRLYNNIIIFKTSQRDLINAMTFVLIKLSFFMYYLKQQ